MAITGISIVQDNKVDGCDLLSIHNPLVFIVEVDYTSTAPDELYVDIVGDSLTFSCILESDPQAGKRRFMFLADEIIRGMMQSFDDEEQADDSLVLLDNSTHDVSLLFRDPTVAIGSLVTNVNKIQLDFIACHATRQFGESPSLNAIFENDNETYLSVEDGVCYAYFFNDNALNVLTVYVV